MNHFDDFSFQLTAGLPNRQFSNGNTNNGMLSNEVLSGAASNVNSSGMDMQSMQPMLTNPATNQVILPAKNSNQIPVDTPAAQPNQNISIEDAVGMTTALVMPNVSFTNQVNLTPMDIQRIIDMNNLNNYY